MPDLILSRRAILRGLAVAAGSPLLGGCISSVTGAIVGDGDAALPPRRPSSLRGDPVVYAVTNRKPAPGGGAPYYSGERGEDLVVAQARFKRGRASLVERAVNADAEDWTLTSVKPFETPEPLRMLADRASGRDVFIYIHGYNVSFTSSLSHAAELSDGIGFQGVTVAFTWPSKAGLLDYGYDRESALYSRDDLQRLLRALIAHPTIGHVHLVAHSMGGLLTLETLREMANEGDRQALAARFGAIVFAAPDVDADVFTAGVRRLGPLAPKLTLITNAGDRALAVSRRLAGGVARAGAADRETLEQLGVRVADASDYGWGVLRHDLFLSNAEVREVVRRAVERGRSI